MIKEWLKHILLPRTPADMQAEVKNIIDRTKPEEVEAMRSNLGQSIDEMMLKERMEGEIEGRAKGRTEGKTEGKLEVAKRLMLKGMSIEEIADITGLSLELVKKVKH